MTSLYFSPIAQIREKSITIRNSHTNISVSPYLLQQHSQEAFNQEIRNLSIEGLRKIK